MEPNKIFELWDEAKKKERTVFRLKAPVIIEDKDSIYVKTIKKLTNHRIKLNLSIDDIANGLGLSRATVSGIESFRGKENWLYVYALDWLFMGYYMHLANSIDHWQDSLNYWEEIIN